jgi:solute:Na+ symporter, SSS family
LGLVVSSLLAAFMSTVSTSINWGASYLTNDLYRRFFKPDASQAELVMIGRLSSIVVTVFGAIAALYSTDITTVFRLVIAIGTGPGLVLILRWFWWRINAAAELAAMLGGFIIGLITSVYPEQIVSLVPGFEAILADFGSKLLFISITSAAIWITVMYLTSPESDATLDEFYRRVQPGGIGWKQQRERTGIPPAQDLTQDLLKVVAATLLLFGSMFAIGGFLLLQSWTGFISLVVGVIGGFWLRQLNKQKPMAMPKPGLDIEV